MANAYGTAEYEQYIENYNNWLNTSEIIKTDKNEEHFNINGIAFDIATVDNHAYENKDYPYPCAHTVFNDIAITLKSGQSKTYSTIEFVCRPQVFNYKGIDYIFIKKTLYGYCIIDSRNFDEYNYFPSNVLEDGEEAFISCEVHCLKDLLLIVGCYWAGPFELYALDLESKKTLGLYDYSNFQGLLNYNIGNCSIKVYENAFDITSTENEKEYTINYNTLKNCIEVYGKSDL